METEKFQELINRAVDGLLSPDEQAELENYLKSHPEARRQHENLKRISEALKKIPRVKPPQDLKQNIMDCINSRKDSADEKHGLFKVIASAFRNKMTWRYGYAFSVGALSAIVVMAVSISITEAPTPIDPSQVSGTLMLAEIPKSGPVLDSGEFSLGDVTGTLSVRQTGDIVILETDIESDKETSINVFFDSTDLSFVGIWQPDNFRGSLGHRANQLDIQYQGKGKYYLLFVNRLSDVSRLTFEMRSGNFSQHLELLSGAVGN
jgi:hypothetical protein